MRRIALAATFAALALAAPGTALIHDLLGGGDAGSGQDADNDCVPGQAPRVLAPLGFSYGQLTPLLDTQDDYLVRALPGQLVTISMDPAPPGAVPFDSTALPNYDLGAKGPTCQFLPAVAGENPSRNPGTTPETLSVKVPSGAAYIVVEVFSGSVPVAAQAQAPAKAAPAREPRGGSGCFPMCYGLSLSAS